MSIKEFVEKHIWKNEKNLSFVITYILMSSFGFHILVILLLFNI